MANFRHFSVSCASVSKGLGSVTALATAKIWVVPSRLLQFQRIHTIATPAKARTQPWPAPGRIKADVYDKPTTKTPCGGVNDIEDIGSIMAPHVPLTNHATPGKSPGGLDIVWPISMVEKSQDKTLTGCSQGGMCPILLSAGIDLEF